MMKEYQNLKTEVIEDIENVWDRIKSDPQSLEGYSTELVTIIWDILLQCRNLILNYVFKQENLSKYLQQVLKFKEYPDDQIVHVIAETIIHQTHYYTTEFLCLYRINWEIDLDVFPTPYFSHEMLTEIILDMINFFHLREKEIQDILNIKHRISIRNLDKFGYNGFIINLKPKPQIEYVYYGNLVDEVRSEYQELIKLSDYNQLKSEVNSQLDILWENIISDPMSLYLYSDQENPIIPDQLKRLIWQIMLKCRNLIFEYIFQPKNYPKYIYKRFLSNNKTFSNLPRHLSKMILHHTHSYIAEILKKFHLEWTRDEEFSGSPLFPPDMLVELYPKFISFFAEHERDIHILLGLKDQKPLKEYTEFCFIGFSIILAPSPHLEPYEIEDRENDIELEIQVKSELAILWEKIISDPNSLGKLIESENITISEEVKKLIWDILSKCSFLIFDFIFRKENYPKYVEVINSSNEEIITDFSQLISQMILHQLHHYLKVILRIYRIKWTRDKEFYSVPLFSSDMLVEIYPKIIYLFNQNEQKIKKMLGIQKGKSIKEYNEFCFPGFSIILKPTPHLEPYYDEDYEDESNPENLTKKTNTLFNDHPENEKVTFATIPESKKEFASNPNQIIKIIIKIVILVLIYIGAPLNSSQLAISSFVGVLIGGIYAGIFQWKNHLHEHLVPLIGKIFNWMWLMIILTYSITLLII